LTIYSLIYSIAVMSDVRIARLESMLRRQGAQSARAIADELGISQPSVSRLIADAGSQIVRLGRARATRYALGHEIARAGSHWPLYRIDADGHPHTLGELHAIHGGQFHFEAEGSRPAFLYGDFADGLFPGLPWFLDDQRPQGFLGRNFARRIAWDIGAPEELSRWQTDDFVLALLRHGEDSPGDLVLGEVSLRRALQAIITTTAAIAESERATRYPELADAVLNGEDTGSSAGGEQPKFTTTLAIGAEIVPMIVKFSGSIELPAGRRWADLLLCEHHAGMVLRDHGFSAAHSEIVEAGHRVFLQSTRFDRTTRQGRCGFASFAAIDAAFYGHGNIDWWRLSQQLQRDGWLDEGEARRLRIISWFGLLIANADMHLGNVAVQLADQRPLRLAPIYDMLPMRFRPSSNGEIVERRYEIAMPAPEQKTDWLVAAQLALDFWQRTSEEQRISDRFRPIATDALNTIERARRHLAG
jgi:hypothetical protein